MTVDGRLLGQSSGPDASADALLGAVATDAFREYATAASSVASKALLPTYIKLQVEDGTTIGVMLVGDSFLLVARTSSASTDGSVVRAKLNQARSQLHDQLAGVATASA